MSDYKQEYRQDFKNGNSKWVGIIFLIVGVLLLARFMGVTLPDWIFSWELILIGIGLIIGVKEGFRKPTWIILVGIGSFFLLDDVFPDFEFRRLVLPAVFIGVGLLIIFKQQRRSNPSSPGSSIPNDPLRTSYGGEDPLNPVNRATADQQAGFTDGLGADSSTETKLDIASIFGGVKKTIMSKYFRGGEIVSIFGGTEVNLLHADMQQPVEIECVNIFGGTKLIIPNNWEVKSEAVAILGGVEDKRNIPNIPQVPNRVLILKGFSMFGGIEIKSY
jgi:predicted membrane protein